MLTVQSEFPNISVALPIEGFAWAISPTQCKHTLILDAVGQLKPAIAVRLAKLPLTYISSPIFKHHASLSVPKPAKPLTTVSRVCLLVVMYSSL